MDLRELRQTMGLTQAQLGALMGVHRVTVTTIEAGKRRLTVEELGRLSHALTLSDQMIGKLVRASCSVDDASEGGVAA